MMMMDLENDQNHVGVAVKRKDLFCERRPAIYLSIYPASAFVLFCLLCFVGMYERLALSFI